MFTSYLCILYFFSFERFENVPSFLWDRHSFFIPFDFLKPEWIFHPVFKVFLLISLFLSAIGLFTAVFTKVSFVLCLYSLGVVQGYSEVDFQYNLPVLVLAIYALSPVGDFFSVDNLIREKFNFKKKDSSVDYNYGWQAKLTIFLLGMMYCSAGISKIVNSGFNWIGKKYLLSYIEFARESYAVNIYNWTDGFAGFLHQNEIVIYISSTVILALELLSPIAILFPATFKLFIFLWLAMHVSVYLLMGIDISYWLLPILFALVPWTGLHKKLSSFLRST